MAANGKIPGALSRLRHRLKPAINAMRSWRLLHGIRLANRHWRASHGGLPDWSWLPARTSSGKNRQNEAGKPERKKRVLIATGTAGHLPSMTMESFLAAALGERGADAEFLLCDGILSACMMCEIGWYSDAETFLRRGPADQCNSCHRPSAKMLDAAQLKHIGLSELLQQGDFDDAQKTVERLSRSEIPQFEIDGVPLGEHACAGALRFFARGDLPENDAAEAVLRRYVRTAILTYRATRRLLATGAYDVVVLNHGIYVPQGVFAETARRAGVRVVTWHPAYRRGCFIFNHNETYHHGLMTEPVTAWQDMRWDENRRNNIAQYLKSRWIGRNDWVRFHNDPVLDTSSIERELGIDFSRPTIGLLTNVVWDAQLHYPANAFDTMLDWLNATIGYFAERPDLQLLIRVHPAEYSGTLPSRQLVTEEIGKAFPELPRNVFIIPPDSRLSTYVAMSQCNAVIIYGTKTGVELTAEGIPVIVAGEAWIRGKGVTLDAESRDDYFRLLEALPLPDRLDGEQQERALRYAYHFFFRRMIPLTAFVETNGWPPFAVSIESEAELAPGACAGLDVVCAGILKGTPFIYPAEENETFNMPQSMAGGLSAVA